jgi:hypothetical protein
LSLPHATRTDPSRPSKVAAKIDVTVNRMPTLPPGRVPIVSDLTVHRR